MNASRRGQSLPLVPWISREGHLDLTEFPVDSVLEQALDPDDDRFRTGCTVLGSMCAAGRVEAGVYLLGLVRWYQDDLERLGLVVESLSAFRSDNSTRRDLDRVIRALSRLPRGLVEGPLRSLAEDEAFSLAGEPGG